MSPQRYRRVVLIASAALAVIVVTGAAVRLTEAGLGCENWPACSEDRFVPELALHPWIEFGNRLLSGVVALATVAAVLSAYRRRPRRRDLILWAWGLVAGVVAQIVLGGITVMVDLHPLLVGAHFLLSMVLLWNAAVLWVRSGSGPGPVAAVGPSSLMAHGWALTAAATVVLVTGTLVTGTGPHAGDSRADRLNFALNDVVRVHTGAVWVFLAVAVALAIRLYRSGGAAEQALRWLLGISLAQGIVGYVQYATGLPPLLVGLHICGAIGVWVTAVLVHLRLVDRPPVDGPDTMLLPSTLDKIVA
ncbi:MAG: heme A synthase [Acidimicrobiales bacterium]